MSAFITQMFESVVGVFRFDPMLLLGEPGLLVQLGLQVFLLAASAFFSSSETALFSLSRLDLQQLRRAGGRQAEIIHELLDQPRRLIISILSGNELINVAATINMTSILVALYGSGRAGWINVVVMLPLLLLFGEVTPKTIAVANPVRYSTRIVARPMQWWLQLSYPLFRAIRSISDRTTTWLVGEPKTAENILNVDEFLTLVEQVSAEGVLDATERALIYSLLEATETEIVEVMTPRTRVSFLNVEQSAKAMIEQFIRYRFQCVPVYQTHRDNLVGFVHAEDVQRLMLGGKEDLEQLTPANLMRAPVVVPLTKKIDEMFDFFRYNQASAAACLNEFGGVEGFITLEDCLNFVFSEVSGAARSIKTLYTERDHNIYEVPGDMKLTDFDDLTNFGIEDPRMTTIGGVAFRLLDRLPQVGDLVEHEDITLQVLEMDAHRVARVRVAKGLDRATFERGEELIAVNQTPQPVAEANA